MTTTSSSNDWGQDQVFESKNAGTDVLDFSAVTEPVTHLLAGKALQSGTGTFTPSSASGVLGAIGFGDISGTFETDANTVSVPIASNANEIQRIVLDGASGGSFMLSLDDTTNALQFGPLQVDVSGPRQPKRHQGLKRQSTAHSARERSRSRYRRRARVCSMSNSSSRSSLTLPG